MRPRAKAGKPRVRAATARSRAPGLVACALLAGLAALGASGATTTTPVVKSAGPPTHYQPDRFAGRAGKYYRLIWGVEALSVKLVESGEIVRFSYRVLDPDKARSLNDTRVEPSLVDPAAGVTLVVPSMEKIGQLRQTGTPEPGKAYWMAFSNKGRHVRQGDSVAVVIGAFHADGLRVD